MTTSITNVRVFDGLNLLPSPLTVTISGPIIKSIDQSPPPQGSTIIDGSGCTLLPGLIDSHVHTRPEQLAIALKFGVTTELEMMGHWTPEQRKEIAERDDLADLRTAEFGLTAPGGHPSELHKRGGPPPGKGGGPPPPPPPGKGGLPPQGKPGPPPHGHSHGPPPGAGGPGSMKAPTATTPSEARTFVSDRIKDGADYIKIMMEEGSVLAAPGLPTLSRDTIIAGIEAAHSHSKLAIAHVLTAEATERAISAGIDGLAHLFLDEEITPELVNLIVKSGSFITPCLCLNASILGTKHSDRESLTQDPRVTSKLTPAWIETLASSFNTYPSGSLTHCLNTVKRLHDAGVDILVGTDASVPMPALGGLAHGASVHHELKLLIEAGLSPVEALRAATAIPAKRFGLDDRGRVVEGLRADLLLVDGDPSVNVESCLDIRGVWRRGTRLEGVGA